VEHGYGQKGKLSLLTWRASRRPRVPVGGRQPGPRRDRWRRCAGLGQVNRQGHEGTNDRATAVTRKVFFLGLGLPDILILF
jgi:hypothetical protein